MRFEGPWQPNERATVQKAIEEAERGRNDAPTEQALAPFMAAAWLCLKERKEAAEYFFAHWLDAAEVFAARSAEELASEIESALEDEA